MKKLIAGLTLLSSMMAFASSQSIEHSTCNIEKFHLINDTIQLDEVSKVLKSKGYLIDLTSPTAQINEGSTHFVDPLFVDSSRKGVTIIVGATEQAPTRHQRPGERVISSSGGLTQVLLDLEMYYYNLEADIADTLDAISSYGHSRSVYIFDSREEESAIYSKTKKTMNKIDDIEEEIEVSKKALDMIPNCIIK